MRPYTNKTDKRALSFLLEGEEPHPSSYNDTTPNRPKKALTFCPLLLILHHHFSPFLHLLSSLPSVAALLNVSSAVSDSSANISWISGGEHTEFYIAYMNNRKLTLAFFFVLHIVSVVEVDCVCVKQLISVAGLCLKLSFMSFHSYLH